ncbi:MAG TPA: hypothetical protein PKD78_10310, partial [Saprospiraceae bacterium]|nr:hypothetical protein [Saprospiraceae bacterium]
MGIGQHRAGEVFGNEEVSFCLVKNFIKGVQRAARALRQNAAKAVKALLLTSKAQKRQCEPRPWRSFLRACQIAGVSASSSLQTHCIKHMTM